MEENLHCYTFELHTFSKGLLDASLDATYVINLRNNGRYKSILKEVTDYKPTRLAYIVLNDGYKTCKKVLPQVDTEDKQNSSYDLIDVNQQIYKHAEQMNYKNILVLEDDCFFRPDIQEENVLKDLNVFFINNSSRPFTYRLGCVPNLMLPFLTHVPYGIYVGTHAYVISKKARQIAIHTDQTTIPEIDTFINFNTQQYAYYKPLAYQLFPETENQAQWGIFNNSYITYITRFAMLIQIQYLKLLGVDTKAEPGYTIAYTIAKIISSLLIFLALFLVYKGVQWIPFLLKGVQPLRKLKGRKSK
jgi:hypothetical protein